MYEIIVNSNQRSDKRIIFTSGVVKTVLTESNYKMYYEKDIRINK